MANKLLDEQDLSLQPELRLNPRQNEVFLHPARFRVLVAGRRFGKTELAVAEIMRVANSRPNRAVWYVGPSEKEAERIMWHRLKRAARPFAEMVNQEHHTIQLANGSLISLKSGFHPDNLRGDGLDFVVLDEVSDLKPELWERILLPSLVDRQGRALFIGTPKGRNHLHTYFELTYSNPDWASFHFTTEQGGIVKPSELEMAARQMDPNAFRQEFNAEFTALGKHRVYLSFDRAVNVQRQNFHPLLPLIWSIDFNVDPLCMLIMQNPGEIVNVLEEIVIRPDATTEKACRAFLKRLEDAYLPVGHRFYLPIDIRVYGDASGNQRRTSGALTDWTQIRDFFHNSRDYRVTSHVASANPPVRDRVNCVNARLRNKLDEARLFIDPSCQELIRDLEEVSWSVDTHGSPYYELDKSDRNRTHLSDALGYFVTRIFPLRVPGQC